MAAAKTWTPWTPKQDELLRELVAQRFTDKQIVEQYAKRGVARTINSIRERVKALELPIQTERVMLRDIDETVVTDEPVTLPPPPPDPIEVERERQERIRTLRAEREALAAIAGERSLRNHIEQIFDRVVPRLEAPKAYYGQPPVPSTTTESLLLHYSDWHYGENVSEDGTRGLNVYNPDIATERVHRVTNSVIGIAEKMRAGNGWYFPRIVVAVNGDLVTGTIHELERHGDHENIVWSVYYCGMLLAEQIRQLAANFPQVDVFITSGNHGRLPDARKMQSKDPTRNWDTVVGLFAKTALEELENVTVEIPNSYAVTYEVEGHTVLQSHGHDVKSWGGIPWYGINRVISGYNALEASRGGRISAYLFGHFHSQTNLTYPGGEAFVNGSLIGGTEWTVNALGRADRPCQMLLGFHAEHGVTHRWPIYAEGL